MGMPDTAGRETRDPRQWTRDAALALPDDGNRYELVDGELLVSPSPRPVHQAIVVRLVRLLAPYVERHRLGTLSIAPADLDLGSEQLVQPDLFVVAETDGRALARWEGWGVPILAIEVLSPATARHDRLTKRRLYQRSRVSAYWIVDPDARMAEVWTPDSAAPEVEDVRLTWQPDPAVEPLVIGLEQIFEDVGGSDSSPG
jgi:Uma2 family endonuclease